MDYKMKEIIWQAHRWGGRVAEEKYRLILRIKGWFWKCHSCQGTEKINNKCFRCGKEDKKANKNKVGKKAR